MKLYFNNQSKYLFKKTLEPLNHGLFEILFLIKQWSNHADKLAYKAKNHQSKYLHLCTQNQTKLTKLLCIFNIINSKFFKLQTNKTKKEFDVNFVMVRKKPGNQNVWTVNSGHVPLKRRFDRRWKRRIPKIILTMWPSNIMISGMIPTEKNDLTLILWWYKPCSYHTYLSHSQILLEHFLRDSIKQQILAWKVQSVL